MNRFGRVVLIGLILGGNAVTPSVTSQATPPATQALAHLVVQVTDLHSQKGQLLFCIFGSAEGFPSDSAKAVVSTVKPANDPVFNLDLPAGNYAAVVVHDENGNGKMDTNFFGIPIEGYGATNNPKPKRRGVRFPESVISLPASGATVKVSIQYDFL